MLVVFATMVVEPAQRAEIAARMAMRLEEVAPKKKGAFDFELLLSATDPARIHVFQTWESAEAFKVWGGVKSHSAFQQEFRSVAKEASSVQFDQAVQIR